MNAADDSQNLPAPADERDQLTLFARCGQLALPGSAAQLGLDGVAYALEIPAATNELEPRSGEPFPRSPHDVLPGPQEAPSTGLQLALQLDPDEWRRAPQLTLWRRLELASELMRNSEWDRDAKCNRTRFAAASDVTVKRSESGSWSTSGVIKCGVWQTCPSCGPAKCREVASKLSVCFDRHMVNPEADVWMLSLTIPHHGDESAELTVDRLYAASHELLRSREWRAFVKRWGVVGRVRVLDATHGGGNGSHPHFHIALFPTAAGLLTTHAWTLAAASGEAAGDLDQQIASRGHWTLLRACSPLVRERYLDEIKGSLVTAWERAVRAAGARIERVGHFRENSVRLSPSENAAAYFTKWGLADEVGASTSKGRNHLRLLDAVGAGIKGAAYLFKQWRRAVDGHALVTGLGDVCRRLGVTDEDAHDWLKKMRERREAEALREGKPLVKVPELQLVIRAHVYAAAMRLGWESVFAFCDETATGGGDVQTMLDAFLWSSLAVTRDSDSS